MTQDEQNAAIGRMVTRLSEAKVRRVALLSEAETFGTALETAGQVLRGLNFVDAFWDGKTRGYARHTADVRVAPYPDVDTVTRVLDELREIAAEIRQLRERLKDAGLSVD